MVNKETNEFPVAAMLLKLNSDGEYIEVCRSVNLTNTLNDSLAHAEMLMMREGKDPGDKHLGENYLLLSTHQPCMMCSGAILNYELGVVIYGLSHRELVGKTFCVQGQIKVFRTVKRWSPHLDELNSQGIRVVGGYMRDELLKKLDIR